MIMEPRMTKISIRTEVDELIKQSTRRVMESELPLAETAKFIANLAQAQKVFNEALDQLFHAIERPPIERPPSDDEK